MSSVRVWLTDSWLTVKRANESKCRGVYMVGESEITSNHMSNRKKEAEIGAWTKKESEKRESEGESQEIRNNRLAFESKSQTKETYDDQEQLWWKTTYVQGTSSCVLLPGHNNGRFGTRVLCLHSIHPSCHCIQTWTGLTSVPTSMAFFLLRVHLLPFLTDWRIQHHSSADIRRISCRVSNTSFLIVTHILFVVPRIRRGWWSVWSAGITTGFRLIRCSRWCSVWTAGWTWIGFIFVLWFSFDKSSWSTGSTDVIISQSRTRESVSTQLTFQLPQVIVQVAENCLIDMKFWMRKKTSNFLFW